MDGITEFQKEKTMHFRISKLSALLLLLTFLMPVEAQKAVNHLGQP